MSGGARRVALVEDDDDLRVSTAQVLTLAGFAVEAFAAAEPALAAIDADWPGLVVTDVRMPHMSGIELLRALHERDPSLPVILVTGHGDVTMAVDALKAGAWDFLTKPFDPEALVAAADRAATARALALDNRRLRAEAQGDEPSGLVGQSPAIRRLREMIPTLANADIDLFIEGETGTGKELLARLIHRAGKRARRRFLAVACAALPDALEDELFAASGEASIAAANRGTLLLDDIDQASRPLQARLAALVEERTLRSPGAREPLPLDLRVIATGGTEDGELADKIAPGLFYRLAALRLRMPPLRERREDIPVLFAHLAGASAARLRRPLPEMVASVQGHLASHDWPGNVRELAHYAERFVLGLTEAAPQVAPEAPGDTLPQRLDAFERETIVAAVLAANGEIGAAIARLGIPRKTFYYKVHKHGIDLTTLRKGAR
ncbi:sigma-54 dependent transcriptional regulator [Novosphingobium sp. AP12]|uniref:sigma-54-dependent transcriptional regulator n=1 Tax=Novosphingobium sp. AP12 TaxID=1144305 RepID=UPI000272056F|nr:sigma-54 dependent transcriptional regulator [Novosphingobium sp. AP12]EJL30706.1 response regulator with CheY-like receiver, AAA-type ATPase, and DNA-binding domains [Novosphingobium sp. AP12]